MSRFALLTAASGVLAGGAVAWLPAHLRWTSLLALVGAWLVVTALGAGCPQMQLFLPAVSRVPGRPNAVALTFDDGPDPHVTPRVLEVLEELGVVATFFMVGSRVRAHPEVARAVARAGHLIGNHSDGHGWALNLWRRGTLASDYDAAAAAIAAVTGTPPRWVRSPMGLTNPRLAWLVRTRRWRYAGWTIRSLDTWGRGATWISRRVIRRLRPGAIVLLHDGGGRDVEALCAVVRAVVAAAVARHYDLVPLEGPPR